MPKFQFAQNPFFLLSLLLVWAGLACQSPNRERAESSSAKKSAVDSSTTQSAASAEHNTAPKTAKPRAASIGADRMADQSLDGKQELAIASGRNLTLNTQLGRVSETCQVSAGQKGSRFVVIVKQWHLAPSVQTSDVPAEKLRDFNRKYPQAENQIAIYRMLENWVSLGQVKTVLVEGCQNGINRAFVERFNGWNLRALERRAQEADYASVLTHVGLKLEAKLGPIVDTVCADDDLLLRQHGLAFSDARGVVGFWTRLASAKSESDPSIRPYLMSVIDLYRLPPDTSIPQAKLRLKTELKEVINRIEAGFAARNQIMVNRALRASSSFPIILVVGGAHASDLKSRFEKSGVACAVVEPSGYPEKDDELLTSLRQLDL